MFTFRIKFKCECLGSFWIWSIKLSLVFPYCQQSRRSKSSLPLAPCSSLLSSFHRVPPLLALLCKSLRIRRTPFLGLLLLLMASWNLNF